MFALFMEPYAMIQCLYCYNHIELWLRISSQAISVCFGEILRFRGTPVEKHSSKCWRIHAMADLFLRFKLRVEVGDNEIQTCI